MTTKTAVSKLVGWLWQRIKAARMAEAERLLTKWRYGV